MATLRRRIVTQFCRDLEGELVLERHRHQLEQPQNDILGRRAPGNGPEDIPLPAIDLYIYIGGYYRRIPVETAGKRPVRRSNRRRGIHARASLKSVPWGSLPSTTHLCNESLGHWS